MSNQHHNLKASHRTRTRLFVGCLLAFVPIAGFAEDRVVVQPGGQYSSRIVIRGEIEDYTGRGLTIRLKSGNQTRTFSPEEILEVETYRSPSYHRGAELLTSGQAELAIPELESALAIEERLWVRREILALLVRCALHRGDYVSAGRQFLILLDSDPTTRHFALIPLAWAPLELNAELRGVAERWLAHETAAGQLMGASFLLDDPARESIALSNLRALSTSTDRRVRELAMAQAWRLRLKKIDIGRIELEHWQVRVEEMLPDLRGGAWYLLGRAYLNRRENELGAAALLWVPLVYDHDRHFAARACLRAAEALADSGQPVEAATLYLEVAQRYADTPFGREALALLESRPAAESPLNAAP